MRTSARIQLLELLLLLWYRRLTCHRLDVRMRLCREGLESECACIVYPDHSSQITNLVDLDARTVSAGGHQIQLQMVGNVTHVVRRAKDSDALSAMLDRVSSLSHLV